MHKQARLVVAAFDEARSEELQKVRDIHAIQFAKMGYPGRKPSISIAAQSKRYRYSTRIQTEFQGISCYRGSWIFLSNSIWMRFLHTTGRRMAYQIAVPALIFGYIFFSNWSKVFMAMSIRLIFEIPLNPHLWPTTLEGPLRPPARRARNSPTGYRTLRAACGTAPCRRRS